jgi:ubiquitin-conjugating enzyme E2 J2
MLEETPTTGSMNSSLRDRRLFAERSWDFNAKNKQFLKMFPDLVRERTKPPEAQPPEEKATATAKTTTITTTTTVKARGEKSAGTAASPRGMKGWKMAAFVLVICLLLIRMYVL